MPNRPEYFGISPAPASAAIVGALGGWVRDSGTATTRLFASTDQVGVGTATAVVGRKLTLLTTGANQGIRISATAATDNVIDALVNAEAAARLSINAAGTVVWGGGGGAGDLRAQRSAASVLALDNGAGGNATLTVRTLGTTALRTDTVTRGANRANRTVTAAGVTNLAATDDIVLFDLTTAGAAQTPTLPDLATNRGLTVNVVRLYDVTAFTVTIACTGANNISGPAGVGATLPILAGVSVVLHAPDTGTNWIVL